MRALALVATAGWCVAGVLVAVAVGRSVAVPSPDEQWWGWLAGHPELADIDETRGLEWWEMTE